MPMVEVVEGMGIASPHQQRPAQLPPTPIRIGGRGHVLAKLWLANAAMDLENVLDTGVEPFHPASKCKQSHINSILEPTRDSERLKRNHTGFQPRVDGGYHVVVIGLGLIVPHPVSATAYSKNIRPQKTHVFRVNLRIQMRRSSMLMSRSHGPIISAVFGCSGQLKWDEEIEVITKDLQCLISKLQESFPSLNRSGSVTKEQFEERKSLESICKRASAIAEEIIQKLDGLVVPEAARLDKMRRKVIKTLQQLIKASWQTSEIKDLMSRLEELRKAINTNIIYFTKQSVDAHSIQMSRRFDELDSNTQGILTSLLNSQRETNQGTVTAIAQMMSRLESLNLEEHRQTDNILVEKSNIPILIEVRAGEQMLAVSSEEEERLRHEVNLAIVEALQYPTMTNRYEDIGEAFPQT
ncbi:hypothetical protein GLAREA_08858 [Glarea lozoyensis ATCC 20868]|uniref:Uncharacterized protein n=1 Tax=Glarea lozoyensis (strain ATCC 20868 / MF5171) TaxID=1116229 RepID=S3DG56_GLAL2|nr:uncharacterized protein GLAREA_08858 [Glarea lozoyensis ATCC 20868]EPE36695.1 hypothetical protein GLAREA_08858 [Glarea lozoyensis ATCC 20868]